MTHPVRLRLNSVLLPCALAIVGAGCGSFGKVKVPEGADKTWEEMSFDDRMALMGSHVNPRMKTVFQEFDGEKFADFGCQTCHGSGASEGTFVMPNPDLPHLKEEGFFKEAREEHPDVVKFMWQDVESNLADAMGVTYGPKGDIACWSCHVVDDREPETASIDAHPTGAF